MLRYTSRNGWILALAAVVLLAPSVAYAGDGAGNVKFFLGAKPVKDREIVAHGFPNRLDDVDAELHSAIDISAEFICPFIVGS